ncbi:unnamed protein product, partial [marine sediment metagenome]
MGVSRSVAVLVAVGAQVLWTPWAQGGPVDADTPKVWVELIPNYPGPYVPHERVTLEFWLFSGVPDDVLLRRVQFDFTDSDPALSLEQHFTFDFRSLLQPGYQE